MYFARKRSRVSHAINAASHCKWLSLCGNLEICYFYSKDALSV